MEVVDCLRTRLTVRRFKPDPVPQSVVTSILQAARWGPSSTNEQPWQLIVIRDRDTLTSLGALATHGSFLAEAPVAIAVAMKGADQPKLDAGRAIQQMEIFAWSEGMGTCFVDLETPEENRKAKELLGVPGDVDLITVLPFGYRPDNIKGIRRRRRPLSGMVHGERFGQPYEEV